MLANRDKQCLSEANIKFFPQNFGPYNAFRHKYLQLFGKFSFNISQVRPSKSFSTSKKKKKKEALGIKEYIFS